MKNKKAIIILSVLILLFLIGSVSASDVNTTDVSASDTDDVTGAVTVDSTDENYVNDLTDESEDLNDSEILSESNSNENDLKENEIGNSNNDFNKEVLSSSNSEILGANNNYDLLSMTTNIVSVSFSTTSATISYYIESYDRNVMIYAKVGSSSYVTETLYLTEKFNMQYVHSGTISVSGTYSPGSGYNVIFGVEGGASSSTVFIYPRETPTVAVSSKSITYNSGTYSVSGTCSANGLTINLKAGSTSLGSATVSNGKWTVNSISSTKLNPGSYTLTATSTETTGYNSASATNTLTVSKSTPTVTVTDKNVNYNTGTYTLGGTVKVGSNNVGTGTVTIYKDGVQIGTASVSGGSWTSSAISSTSYDAGSYNITASYASNTYYNANSGKGTLTISKVTPTITVSTAPDIKYGNGIYTVSGTAKYGSNNVDVGTITLKCGDTVLGTCSVSGGLWTVSNIDTTLVDPNPNPYTITAYYESNVNYNGASAGNYLTVNKFTPDISIESTLIWYNQSNGGVLKGKVYTYNGDFYSGFIDLYVNGELVASNVNVSSSGIWTYALSSTTNLSPGTYSIGVVWKGNEYTNGNSATENKYTVSKGMVIPIITSTGNIDIGRTEYVYVDVNNVMGGGYLSGMTVTLQGSGIEGILQEISDVNGRATFTVSNLMAGKYDDWKIAVASNDYYYPTMDSFNVGMFYVQYPLTVNITNISPNNSTYPEEITVTGFTDADQTPQGNVSLTIGGKTYTAFFDSNGNFTASLIGVKPGTYNNVTAKYNPTVDEFYYRGVESTVSISETRMIIC